MNSRSGFLQCFGSEFNPDSFRLVDPDPDLESGSGFGIRIRIQEAKMTYKNIKNLGNLCFEVLWAEGFFCSLDVRYGGLGIRIINCNF